MILITTVNMTALKGKTATQQNTRKKCFLFETFRPMQLEPAKYCTLTVLPAHLGRLTIVAALSLTVRVQMNMRLR